VIHLYGNRRGLRAAARTTALWCVIAGCGPSSKPPETPPPAAGTDGAGDEDTQTTALVRGETGDGSGLPPGFDVLNLANAAASAQLSHTPSSGSGTVDKGSRIFGGSWSTHGDEANAYLFQAGGAIPPFSFPLSVNDPPRRSVLYVSGAVVERMPVHPVDDGRGKVWRAHALDPGHGNAEVSFRVGPTTIPVELDGGGQAQAVTLGPVGSPTTFALTQDPGAAFLIVVRRGNTARTFAVDASQGLPSHEEPANLYVLQGAGGDTAVVLHAEMLDPSGNLVVATQTPAAQP